MRRRFVDALGVDGRLAGDWVRCMVQQTTTAERAGIGGDAFFGRVLLNARTGRLERRPLPTYAPHPSYSTHLYPLPFPPYPACSLQAVLFCCLSA